MTLSLRLRVLVLVATINVAVFGAGLYFLIERLADQRAEQAREFSELLDYTLPATIKPGGELKVAQILRWPHWKHFADAILVDRNLDTARGSIVPQGVFLNPVGSWNRRADFDREAVLKEISRAIEHQERQVGALGTAVPILDPEGRVWGGCWYRTELAVDTAAITASLVPWFLVSTLLLTIGTFSMMRRFVLDPVADIARGAQRVAQGDLNVRLREPERKDEIADLIRRFNTMTATVQGFNERLAHEVEEATQKVRRAETAAMTQRRLAAMGELAAGIAHEINNPLGGLLNAVESLSRGNLPPDKQAQYHGLLQSGLERIQATVGKLLRLAPRASRAAPLALVDPVLDAAGLVQHRAARQGVTIDIAPLGDRGNDPAARVAELRTLPLVLGEQNELAQAVLNLLVNSLDALEQKPPGEGRIDVRLGLLGDDVAIVLQDNGAGVPQSELPRVADLFYTTKDVGRGTGLGLALVHAIVASHGGRVHLSSPPGAGFRVEIVLPAWRSVRKGNEGRPASPA
jgi:signal transduction histidine kinase